MDIIITTPKSQMKAAAQEAADAKSHIRAGARPRYFRRFPTSCYPVSLTPGDRVYYVEDGYVRGFAVVVAIVMSPLSGWTCETTGKRWPPGMFVFVDAKSWKWIEPAPMRGFRGFRYLCKGEAARYFGAAWKVKIVGDWRDPKPEVAA